MQICPAGPSQTMPHYRCVLFVNVMEHWKWKYGTMLIMFTPDQLLQTSSMRARLRYTQEHVRSDFIVSWLYVERFPLVKNSSTENIVHWPSKAECSANCEMCVFAGSVHSCRRVIATISASRRPTWVIIYSLHSCCNACLYSVGSCLCFRLQNYITINKLWRHLSDA